MLNGVPAKDLEDQRRVRFPGDIASSSVGGTSPRYRIPAPGGGAGRTKKVMFLQQPRFYLPPLL